MVNYTSNRMPQAYNHASDADLDGEATHMSTASPPPPHDPPAGSGASPADPPSGAQPTGPTSYETPGYQPLFDPSTPAPEGGRSEQSPTGYPPPGSSPQFEQPQPGYPQHGQPQGTYPPQAGQPQGEHLSHSGQAPPPSGYPQQDLLPQDVKPGRSRKPLVIGLVVALALVAGGITAWLLLRDDGESTREAYCTAVTELAPNDDLIGAISNADTATLDRAKELPGLAPTSVADDWKTIEEMLTSASQSSSQLSPTMVLQAYGALQSIIDDSNKNCGTAYELLPSP